MTNKELYESRGFEARRSGRFKNAAEAFRESVLSADHTNIDVQAAFSKGWQRAGSDASTSKLMADIETLKAQLALAENRASDLEEKIALLLLKSDPEHPKEIYGSGGGGGGGDLLNITINDRPQRAEYRWHAPMTGHWYMRRLDTGQLFCQDGKPVAFYDYGSCALACAELERKVGIQCAPDQKIPADEGTKEVSLGSAKVFYSIDPIWPEGDNPKDKYIEAAVRERMQRIEQSLINQVFGMDPPKEDGSF